MAGLLNRRGLAIIGRKSQVPDGVGKCGFNKRKPGAVVF